MSRLEKDYQKVWQDMGYKIQSESIIAWMAI